MSGITTHVLDTARGVPAAGVAVRLERGDQASWSTLAEALTDGDGRCRDLLAPDATLVAGRYRLSFASGAYFARLGTPTFFPEIVIDFEVVDPAAHHHVPLLLAPFAYSTYRGS